MNRKAVLVTGATGFLGGAFLDRVLTEATESSPRYVLLARGLDQNAARTRILARLSRFRPPEVAQRLLDTCQVVCADLQKPETLEQSIFDEITHVVHLGANTSFIAAQGVWETNYHGTLALARRLLRAKQMERFLYVGTAMICGDSRANMVREDEFPAAHVKHLVEYTASKASAEHALLHEFGSLPLVVARPSIVVGHTRLGSGPSGSIFWVFRALDEVGLVSVDPTTTGIDVVPVDWVAEGLERLLWAPKLAHRIYHLSAGVRSRTNLAQLTHAFSTAQERVHRPERFVRIRSSEVRQQRARLVDAFGKMDGRRMELVLSLYLHFCELDITFDNARILAEGLSHPPPLTEYLATCLNRPGCIGIIEQAADEL
ncbi:MAG: SDR family oxidoreductase [Myxococcales bacterium]